MAKMPVKRKASTAVTTVPNYINVNDNRGNEEVTFADLIVPRIEIVQALSPCKKKSDPSYIAGAEDGMLFNTVTRELYGSSIEVLPVKFTPTWLVWKDRQSGGGFRGSYGRLEEATARIMEEPDPKNFNAVPTNQHFVLVLNDDDEPSEAVISMARTKLKVSKQWNSLIRINGGARFARIYTLFTTEDGNDKGTYFNFGVTTSRVPSKDLYDYAGSIYDSIKSGERKLMVDNSIEGAAATGADDY